MKIIQSKTYKKVFADLIQHPPVGLPIGHTKGLLNDDSDTKDDVKKRMLRKKPIEKKKKKLPQLNLVVDDVPQEEIDIY